MTEPEVITFAGRHDNRFIWQLGLVVLAMAAIVWATVAGYIVLGIFGIPTLGLVLIILLAQLWRTKYSLSAEFLEAKCGFQTVLVEYDSICQVQQNGTDALPPVAGYVPFSLCQEKIYIVYEQDKKKYRLELSPADPAGFLALLGQRMDEDDREESPPETEG